MIFGSRSTKNVLYRAEYTSNFPERETKQCPKIMNVDYCKALDEISGMLSELKSLVDN